MSSSPSKSTLDPSIPPLKPSFPCPTQIDALESPSTALLIESLKLHKHVEGGYFAEIDRHPLVIPNPFGADASSGAAGAALETSDGRTALVPRGGDDAVRNASTSIYYLLTPARPLGAFHRNKGRTVHTLIRGRGRYVIIHADEGVEGEKKRVETFVVGRDFEKGERSVWVVEGGKFKGTFVMGGDGDALLISETVVPGFEYSDHDFLTERTFRDLVTDEQGEELAWMLRQGKAPEAEELL